MRGHIPAQAVCTAIRDDIVSGVLAPGSRLTEDILAARYGVSRVPVREALRTLQSEGFVTTRHHAGACVAEPTEQEAADLLDMRPVGAPGRRPRGRPPRPEPTSRCCAASSGSAGSAPATATPRTCATGRLVPRDPRPGGRQPQFDGAAHPAAAEDRVDVRRGTARPRRVVGRARRGAGRGGPGRRRAARAIRPLHIERSPAVHRLRRPGAAEVRKPKQPVNTARARH